MKYNEEQIGKNIKKERTKRGWSQTTLGKKLNIVGKQVSNYEKGKPIPPLDVMLKMCDIFDCELGYLLGETNYSEGSKLETAIYNYIGVNVDSMRALHKITGEKRDCLDFGYESESYKKMMNSMFCSKFFQDFILCQNKLNQLCFEYNKNINAEDLKKELGEASFEEMMKLYPDFGDYQTDFASSNLNEEQIETLRRIDYIINRQHELLYSIKVARYELYETFEKLVNDLFPLYDNN